MKFLISLILPVLLVSGCSESGTSYQTWSIEDNWRNTPEYLNIFPKLTFEYPVCFQEEEPLMRIIDNTHGIRFKPNEKDIEKRDEQSMSKEDLTEILIRLWALDEMERESNGHFDAAEFLDSYGQMLEAPEESAIIGTPTVSGLPAVSIRSPIYPEGDIFEDIDLIWTITYFEYNGILIDIIMVSPVEEAEEVEKYYNHVLESFRIID